MKEGVKITNEMVDRYISESDNDRLFGAHIVNALAKALKEERATRKDNPGVWDEAPEKSGFVAVNWFEDRDSDSPLLKSKDYTRILPKSREDEIAKKAVDRFHRGSSGTLADIIKAALAEYAESLKAKE